MKPCFSFIFLLFSFISAGIIYPQDTNKQDSLSKTYDKNFFEPMEKNTSLFISLASGYGNIISDDKYNALWPNEASFGVLFNNHWSVGFRFEFWRSTYKGYVSPGQQIDISYNGSGFNLTGGYKGNFLKNKLSAGIGLGFGRFIVDKGDYMSIIVYSDFSYYPVNDLSIDLKGSVKFITQGISPGGSGSRGLLMPGIKIGTSYYIQF